MEADKNIMPKIEVLPIERVKELGKRTLDFLFHLHDTPLHYSNHYRGAEEMLSSVEPTPVQGRLDLVYIDRSRV